MNILFLTPQLPYPPRQGATIRNFNLIQRLAQRHQVDLLTFLAQGESLEPSNWLTPSAVVSAQRASRSGRSPVVAGTLFSPLPDMAHRLASPAMNALIDQAPAQAYELVQIEGIEMAPYGLRLLRRSQTAAVLPWSSTTTTANICCRSVMRLAICARPRAGSVQPTVLYSGRSCGFMNGVWPMPPT